MKKLVWRSLLAFLALFILYQLWIFLHIWWWVGHNPDSSAFMEAQKEILQAENPGATIKQNWVPYSRISRHLKRAVIAAEDAKFVEHDGFDWDGIRNAFQKNMKQGKLVAGGSTISQQLAKNLFLSGRRTPWRKIEEAMITMMLEHTMSKQRILEIYLNIIEWGNGVFGAEAAARHYYNTSAAMLGAEQSAKLAAMVPNPRYYDRQRNASGLWRKTGIILRRMSMVKLPSSVDRIDMPRS